MARITNPFPSTEEMTVMACLVYKQPGAGQLTSGRGQKVSTQLFRTEEALNFDICTFIVYWLFILFSLCKKIIVGKSYFEKEVRFRGIMSASESLRKFGSAESVHFPEV